MQLLRIPGRFPLENGAHLSGVEVAFHTYGKLNAAGDNVVWICHALTANSDPLDWWKGLAGEGQCFDPEKHFIVCANVLGSCYGTTGPLSPDENGEIYYHRFPDVTIRDMVQAHIALRKHLGISQIQVLTGGSIGSFQSVEWAIMEPNVVKHLIMVAGGVKATSWTAGLNEAQRMAIQADTSFLSQKPDGGIAGMKAARAIALLSYRNSVAYNQTQTLHEEDDFKKLKAITYQQYQGEKLAKRFNAYSYFVLTRAFDSHHVGRKRGGLEKALALIKAKTLVIGIDTDILFPKDDQELIKKYIPEARLEFIHSDYGHDGFLLEHESITNIVRDFMVGVKSF